MWRMREGCMQRFKEMTPLPALVHRPWSRHRRIIRQNLRQYPDQLLELPMRQMRAGRAQRRSEERRVGKECGGRGAAGPARHRKLGAERIGAGCRTMVWPR